jgi:mannose-6-phosphate isomerase-like protein (cupin superfamily)
MRIAMLSPGRTHSSHDDHIRRMIGLLADGLAARGVDVTLFPVEYEHHSGPLRPSSAPPSENPTGESELDTSRYLNLSDLFERADDFDLIHNHAGFFPLTYAGLVKRPMLTTMHGCSSGLGLPVYRKYNGRTYYVAVCQARRMHDLNYEATIYYGIDVESFTFNPDPATYILFQGPIRPDRGVNEAIQIARLADRPLVLAGAIDDERFFSEKIAPLLDDTRIRYVGPEQADKHGNMVAQATALLHPVPSDEPFDFTILEANACGTPVVAFSHGLLTEIIADGVNGFSVPDVPAAAAAVNRIHSVSREGCRTLAEERFSQQRMVAAYLNVYERILERTKTEDRRPWGYYVVLSDLPDHKVKRIVVWPDKRLSLQSHRLRSEHWTIIAGAPLVTVNGKEISMKAGQSIDIPVGTEHRIYNPGQDPVVFIEVQMGEYFGEDDIIRFEDDFGRF